MIMRRRISAGNVKSEVRHHLESAYRILERKEEKDWLREDDRNSAQVIKGW